jgi:hypothetical protein
VARAWYCSTLAAASTPARLKRRSRVWSRLFGSCRTKRGRHHPYTTQLYANLWRRMVLVGSQLLEHNLTDAGLVWENIEQAIAKLHAIRDLFYYVKLDTTLLMWDCPTVPPTTMSTPFNPPQAMGRSTVAAARWIAIPYSWNAMMRTLRLVPIQSTIRLRHLRLNSRSCLCVQCACRSYLPRSIPGWQQVIVEGSR